ncbi:MAG: PPC domain-containing protein [Pirellulales bacterium]|nr:PPC domain-containing protein [Pirellulales bacterium]
MKQVASYFTLFAMLAVALPVFGQAPPTLGSASPTAMAPGQGTNVTLSGGNLTGATKIWLSFPATAELAADVANNGQDAGQTTWRITPAAGLGPGIGAVRVAGPGGISPPMLVAVDDLATVTDNGQNKTVETAQEITLPTAIDGVCEAESFDFYRFEGHAGQRVSVEVLARRLGTPLDPVVRLLDASGRELAYSDDEPGLGSDCRFAYELTADGTYYLEIRDIRYQGGGAHRYRLRVGNFPLTTGTFPVAAQKGTTPRIEWVGPAVEGLASASVNVPRDTASPTVWTAAAYPSGQGSGWASLSVSSGVEAIEFEPNDTAEQASPVELPAGINGRFAAPRDRDFYQFAAKGGTRYTFRGETREHGSPTDLYLRLYKADGSVLAEAEDSAGNEEGVLDVTFPEDGTYRLEVEDLLRRGGSDHVYRIDAQPYQPGFTLAIEATTLNAPQSGVFVAKVTSARRDYNGPITLSIEGAGEGIALADHVIPEGKNETTFRATLPASLAAGTLANARIVGRAKVGEADVSAVAHTLPTLRGQFNGLPYPPAELDGVVGIGVGPAFADFFKLAVDGDLVTFPQLIGTTSFEVKTERLNGFDEAVALAIEGLPAGFSAEVKPIEKGQASAAIAVKGPATIAEGDYPLVIRGSGNFQNQPRTVTLESVTLRVGKPLGITAAAAGPLVTGTTQKLKLTAHRFGEEKGAIQLALQGLPLGVSAPTEITIAEGQNEVEIDLTAAADAMLGQAQITAIGSTTVQGRAISVTSSPAPLEVKMP